MVPAGDVQCPRPCTYPPRGPPRRRPVAPRYFPHADAPSGHPDAGNRPSYVLGRPLPPKCSQGRGCPPSLLLPQRPVRAFFSLSPSHMALGRGQRQRRWGVVPTVARGAGAAHTTPRSIPGRGRRADELDDVCRMRSDRCLSHKCTRASRRSFGCVEEGVGAGRRA